MEPVDNNQFEVVPSTKSKRKIQTITPCPNVYLNPALDLLANDDPMCNTAMEVVPNKKRKRTRSCEIAAFENTALDLGISKAAINEFLVRELENVRKNVRLFDVPVKSNIEPKEIPKMNVSDPIYTFTDVSMTENVPIENRAACSLDNMSILPIQDSIEDNSMLQNCVEIPKIDTDSGISVLEQKSIDMASVSELQNNDLSAINTTNIQTNVTNQIFVNNTSNLSLSFIDRLALDSPNTSNQSLYFDDDLNESNIMEIKTITIITKKKRIPEKKKNTNPFLDPNLNVNVNTTAENPFLNANLTKPELEYNDEAINRPIQATITQGHDLMPRRLFSSDTNSTISTVNESGLNIETHEYENIDDYRPESPIYENVCDEAYTLNYNKQSKVLGHDVSRFSAIDIMNLNKQANSSNESNDSKNVKHGKVLKTLKKKVLKTLKKTFKSDKSEHNLTLNPYEVPRKPPKQKTVPTDSGIENPALNLDNSDEIEIEEIDDDDEHQYETIKTIRNTRLNMNVTPLRERVIDNIDISQNKSNMSGKKVRFNATLNTEKVITGNSFDYDIQSPGFDAKIDKYHDELENCINERKFLQQNM